MTAHGTVAGDGTPCDRCGAQHVTRSGGPACTGHSKRTGKACTNSPMHGQRVCSMHGGKTPAALAKASERLQQAEAERMLARRGFGQGRRVIDPADAMLELVHNAAHNVAVLEEAIARLRPELDRVRWDGRDEAFVETLDPEDRRNAPRIGSPIADSMVLYLEGRQSDTIAPHTLMDLHHRERLLLLKACVDCRRLGVDERRIEMSEEQGRQLGRFVRATVAATLALVRAALEAGTLTPEHLDVIEAVEAPPAIAQAVREVRQSEADRG